VDVAARGRGQRVWRVLVQELQVVGELARVARQPPVDLLTQLVAVPR